MLQKSITSKIIIILVLILFSMTLLGYGHQQQREVKAQSSSSISEPGSGIGILTCPTGEIHKAAIAFEATSTASSSSVTGSWDISTHSISADVFKSGIITGGNVSPSLGHFTLIGKETSDDICSSGSVSSISIKIIGQCVIGGSAGGLTTVKFRSSNGEKADFPSSPTCSSPTN
jgi:hypothetical protein